MADSVWPTPGKNIRPLEVPRLEAPPSGVYLHAGYYARLTVRTMITTAYVGYRYLVLSDAGEWLRAESRLLPAGGTFTADYSDHDFYVPMPQGWLVNFEVQAGGSIPVGAVHVSASIITGSAGVGFTWLTLVQGPLYTHNDLCWPDNRTFGYIPDGYSGQYAVTGSNPAAGAEVSETVPTNTLWRLDSLRVTLVTSATVATRQVHLIVDDGTTTVLDIPAADTQAASLTRVYTFAPITNRTAIATGIFTEIPAPLYLPEAYRVRTSTDNIQAADDFAAPVIWVMRRYLQS